VNYISNNLNVQQTILDAATMLPPPPPIKEQQPQRRQQQQHQIGTTTDGIVDGTKYQHCPFRDSSLVESIYVYPSPGSAEFTGDILSDYARSHAVEEYPWIAIDAHCKQAGIGPYELGNQLQQYNTELLVRDIILHPHSCLRTHDPEQAKLFYVPYLPSAEFHNGTLGLGDYKTTKYGQAIMNIMREGQYDGWETTFGLTSKYWQRRDGADHIMVYSEPMHGLWHPRNKRGNYHFINSQFQLRPPIAITVELSTTFVEMYPHCARKNIVMPYPNTDGRFFNGVLDQDATNFQNEIGIQHISDSSAASQMEKQLDASSSSSATTARGIYYNKQNWTSPPRILSVHYKGGHHGTCRLLRQSMAIDFKCTPSGQIFMKHGQLKNYAIGYRQATFCPCPGGDSPSAKRMFDSLISGCIPVILSHDFVWPFSGEFDRIASSQSSVHTTTARAVPPLFDNGRESGKILVLNPNEYSIRLQVQDHQDNKFDGKTCTRLSEEKDLQTVLDAIPFNQLETLKRGVERAGYAYSYYQRRPDLPNNPLREGILPDGGAAQILIRALEERAEGKLWPACEKELEDKTPYRDKVNVFKC
jgi:hypothetical protein